MAAFGVAQPAAASHNPNNDVEIADAATDGISCVSWSPSSNLLVAGSWSNEIRCWDVQMNGQAVPKAAVKHDGPVLCASWSTDGRLAIESRCWSAPAGRRRSILSLWDGPSRAAEATASFHAAQAAPRGA